MRDNITSSYITSSALTVLPEYLAYLDFSGSAPVRVWTGIENKVFTDFSGSATYQAVGTLGSISAVNETSDTSARGMELTLSGVPSANLSLALSNNYRGRTAVVYLVLFNSDHSAYQQTMIFRGRMDQLIINEGEQSSTITVKCESRLIDLNRPRERRYTNEYQQSIHPGDTGLEFISGMADKSIYWGVTAPVSTIASTGGGDGADGNNSYAN